MKHTVASLLVAGVAAVSLSACGAGSGDDRSGAERTIDVSGESVPVARLQQAAIALCTARDEARTDVKRANATFYDRSHDALHTIARALGPIDRAAAGRLLEDKERVEADLEADQPGPELAADLDGLARVTRSGLAALSISVPACP